MTVRSPRAFDLAGLRDIGLVVGPLMRATAGISGRVCDTILIYTEAPDSEGTLGGLVTLGKTANIEQHLDQALEGLEICSSDPLCAETQPEQSFLSLHGAACHNCLFLPETSCERGNRYLDRTVLVPTMERSGYQYFRP